MSTVEPIDRIGPVPVLPPAMIAAALALLRRLNADDLADVLGLTEPDKEELWLPRSDG